MTIVLLPREHGAYGQLALPLVTALGAAGVTGPGLLLAASAVAAFIAHEPASILLGRRGGRARRTLGTAATRWLVTCGAIAAAAVTIAFVWLEEARWSLAVPAVPAVLLGAATIRGHEKSWHGEVAAAATFSAMAMPVAMAAGMPPRLAAAIALPFTLLFVAGTLAVRTVILRVRGGGDLRATSVTRRSTVAVTAGGGACLTLLCALGVLPLAALVAATPGLMVALAILTRPPQPTRLRPIGWTLVAVAVFAAATLAAAV